VSGQRILGSCDLLKYSHVRHRSSTYAILIRNPLESGELEEEENI
jgi:hypothetical protein